MLSVIRVDTADEALEVENNNPHGNAACIYTQSGASGEYFSSRFRTPPDLVGGPDLKILVVLRAFAEGWWRSGSAMIGVNIGIPVPREPFSFGGLYGVPSACPTTLGRSPSFPSFAFVVNTIGVKKCARSLTASVSALRDKEQVR